jgi:hypothetical protein
LVNDSFDIEKRRVLDKTMFSPAGSNIDAGKRDA